MYVLKDFVVDRSSRFVVLCDESVCQFALESYMVHSRGKM